MRKNIEKCNRFGGPKIDPFWGHGSIKKKNTNPEADPKTGQFLDHQNGDVVFNIFAHFGAIFCGIFRLPSATDVVFLHAC